MSVPLSFERTDNSSPLKVCLFVSDDPQQMYLRHRIGEFFPEVRVIEEPGEGERRHLWRKKKYSSWVWMHYHRLRGKLTGAGKKKAAYFQALMPEKPSISTSDLKVDSVNCQAVWEALDQWKPEISICCGTKYIGRKALSKAGLMLNIHTGILPYYKGNHCIFFALAEGQTDKVGASLHLLTPELDGGGLLEIVRPTWQRGESEALIYAKSVHLGIDRMVEHLRRYAEGEKLVFSPQIGEGQMFRHSDRSPLKELSFWWRQKRNKLPAGKAE